MRLAGRRRCRATTDEEIVALPPLRLPMSGKPLAIAYGTAELPPLIADSRDLHARRSAADFHGLSS